jgi:hypothetical protein
MFKKLVVTLLLCLIPFSAFAGWKYQIPGLPLDYYDKSEWITSGSNTWYGLNGNIGIGTTAPAGIVDISNKVIYVDAVAEIQIAVDVLEAGSGGIVHILPGTYTLTTQINIAGTKSIIIEGSGVKATIINLATAALNGFVIGSEGANTNYCQIRDLFIQGYNTTQGDAYDSGDAITFINHSFGGVKNVRILKGKKGIYIYSTGALHYSYENVIDSVSVEYCETYGLYIATTGAGDGTYAWTNAQKISNSRFAHSGTQVRLADEGTNNSTNPVASNSFSNIFIEDAIATSNNLLQMVNADFTKFVNCHFDGQSDNPITLDANSGQNTFIGCLLQESAVTNSGGYNGFWVNGNHIDASSLAINSGIVSTSNVGIGTSNPTEKLHISGSVGTTEKFKILGTIAADTSVESILSIATGELSLIARGDITNRIDANNNSANNFDVIADNSNYVLRITDTGNVGIGTTSPTARLHIIGSGTTGNFALQIQNNAKADKIIITDRGNIGIGTTAPTQVIDIASSSFYAVGGVAALGSITGGLRIGSVSVYDLSFYAGAADRMWISDTTGNVGIGTTLPAEKLEVVGKIISDANIDIKNGATGSGILAIYEDSDDGANFASFQVPALAANTVYTLPVDDGGAGEVLSTNGSGVLDWIAAGAGDVISVGDCTDGACLDGTSDGGTNIALYDGDSNKTTISMGNAAGDLLFILPPDDGDAGEQLQTNGGGTLTWEAAGGAGATAFDDIGDPDAATTIAFDNDEPVSLSSAEDTGSVLTLLSTDADLAGDTILLTLSFQQATDVNQYFLQCKDNLADVPAIVFKIGTDGNTTIAGTLGVTGQITGNLTGNVTGNADTATTALNVDTEAEIEAITGALFGASKVVTAGYLWVADGTDFESVPMSGDVGIASGGAATIADSVTVTGWVMGASTATTPAANDADTSLATTAFTETTQDYLKTSEFVGANEAYDATNWDADTSVPEKDDIRDKIETMPQTAGDALTLTGTDMDFDGGASPGGELGGTWASPTIDADAVLYNEIGDAGGDATIAMGANEVDWTSTIDAAGEAVLTITNTDADAANNNTLLTLSHNDGADINVFYLSTVADADGTPLTTFSLQQTATVGAIGMTFGATGVIFTDDADGAITITGASAGADEDLRINLDDTANVVVMDSSTAATELDWLGTSGSGALFGLGSTGVVFSDDADGALTITGRSAGADENIVINLDDTADKIVISSGTSANEIQLSSLDLLVGGGNINTGNIPLIIGDATTDNICLITDGTTAEVGIGNTAPQGLLDVGTSPGKGLIVLANGNVGIGTTNPTEKLEVKGNIKSNMTEVLYALTIINPETNMDGMGKPLSSIKNYLLTKATAQTINAGTNVIFTLKCVKSDGTTVQTNLAIGQTATRAALTITSATLGAGATIPAGFLLVADIESISGGNTNTMFRLQVEGQEY